MSKQERFIAPAIRPQRAARPTSRSRHDCEPRIENLDEIAAATVRGAHVQPRLPRWRPRRRPVATRAPCALVSWTAGALDGITPRQRSPSMTYSARGSNPLDPRPETRSVRRPRRTIGSTDRNPAQRVHQPLPRVVSSTLRDSRDAGSATRRAGLGESGGDCVHANTLGRPRSRVLAVRGEPAFAARSERCVVSGSARWIE